MKSNIASFRYREITLLELSVILLVLLSLISILFFGVRNSKRGEERAEQRARERAVRMLKDRNETGSVQRAPAEIQQIESSK